MTSPIRVLHAPTTVGGNSSALSQALKQLGLKSEVLALEQNYFRYPADHFVWEAGDSLLLKEFKRIKAFFRFMIRCDIVHYNFGTTLAAPYACELEGVSTFKNRLKIRIHSSYLQILQRLELFILGLLNKPVFVTYQGDDARQGDYSRANFKYSIAHNVGEDYYNSLTDDFKRKSIALLYKHSQQIFSVNPDLLHVLPDSSRFIPYSHLFIESVVPQYPELGNRPLRIAHAPTSRAAKGTNRIVEVLNQLKKEGYAFEFILVEGLSHEQAMEKYRDCDVLIDQIYAGWYGGLAVECMAMGKPSLAYIREDDLQYIPVQMARDLPILRISPGSLVEDLKRVLTMSRDELYETGIKSRHYVEKWHNPLEIARELSREYQYALERANSGAR